MGLNSKPLTRKRGGLPPGAALVRPPRRGTGGETPGYLFTPSSAGPFPTILHIGGYDNTAEENFASAGAALVRNWAFVSLDGPGTGIPLYRWHETMRLDCENVVAKMVDLVISRREVDPSRVVLVGRSFGGLLAPRALQVNRGSPC